MLETTFLMMILFRFKYRFKISVLKPDSSFFLKNIPKTGLEEDFVLEIGVYLSLGKIGVHFRN